MTLWIDAQLSPALASWVTQTFDIPAAAVRELGMRDARGPRDIRGRQKSEGHRAHQGQRFRALA
ncbi:MAG: hypothetical protein NUV55_09340 [Sulfuricaulis sp.]|nr:hypothetical protein [Sulfuricaulis sp.]MCR4347387.1 hypothetical protein [Sulfuricaulis sp.]